MDDAERAALRAKYERAVPPLPAFSIRLTHRGEVWGVVLVILLGLLFSLRVPLQRSDDFYKVIGAMSLAAGQGYCDISRPDAPFLTKYPPLASLLMAPFLGLVGDFLRPLRLLSMLSYLACIPLAYPLLRARVGHRGALALLLLAGLSPTTLRGLNFEGNAGLMSLLVVSVLFLLERARSRFSLYDAALLGCLLALYCYLHRIGLVFAVAASVYVLVGLRARRAAVVTGLVALALVSPWLWRSYQRTGHWVSPEYEAEIQARAQGADSVRASAEGSALGHVWTELRAFPSTMGYGLLPWSHASGGRYWPWLEQSQLTWVATLGEGGLTVLLLLGWGRALLARRGFLEPYLFVHTLMLLAFFVGFQYYLAFLPWLYLYVAEGAALVLVRLSAPTRRRLLQAGLCVFLLVSLAKDAKAFWLYRGSWQDRDLRWAWVARFVPKAEAVYYPGLSNYALSQLRFFDSGRMAVGLTEGEVDQALRDPASPVRWLCLDKTASRGRELRARGWEPVVAEPDFVRPTERTLSEELSQAQRAYLAMMAPPQALWHRR